MSTCQDVSAGTGARPLELEMGCTGGPGLLLGGEGLGWGRCSESSASLPLHVFRVSSSRPESTAISSSRS